MEKWLDNEFNLCYVNMEKLFQWIKENNLEGKDFQSEENKWEKKISQEPNFFSNTELLLIHQDIVILKVFSDSHASFLVKTYQLEYQIIFQNLFQENKNVILVNDKQWKEKEINEEIIILFKDKENIEKSLNSWLERFEVKR